MRNKTLAFILAIVLIGSFISILCTPVSSEESNDLIIDKNTSFKSIRYVQDGNIVVKDKLEILDTRLEILQDKDNQYSFIIEEGGCVIMRNSVILSISTQNGASTPSLILYLKGDAYLEMHDSSIGAGVSVVCDDNSAVDAFDSFLYNSLVLNDNSRANLNNTICGSISASNSGKAEIYRYLNVNVEDSAGVPIPYTEIEIKPTLSSEVYISSATGDDGTAKIPVLTDVIDKDTYPGSQFVGNYNVTVRYDGYSSSKDVTLLHYQTYSSPEIKNIVNGGSVDITFPDVLIPPSKSPFYSKDIYDMNIDGEKTITIGEGTWAVSGNIHIKDNGKLNIKNTALEVLQTEIARYCIIVEDNGTLNIEGSIVSSNYPLNLYLYDNATLNVAYSDLKLNMIGARGFSNIVLDHSSILSSFNCIMRKANITQKNIKISDSVIESSKLFIQSPHYDITNSTFNQALIIGGADGEDSRAELINVTASSIVAKENAIANTYYWLTVKTVDLDNRPVSGCEIAVLQYDPKTLSYNESKTYLTDGYNNGKGVVTFKLHSQVIMPSADVFVGNYKVVAYHQNNETLKSNEIIVAMNNNKYTVLRFTELIVHEFITVTASLNPTTVPSGGEVVVTGHAVLNHGNNGMVANATVRATILETNTTWYTTTDSNGDYRVVITAPNQKGKYTVEVHVTTDHINGVVTKTFVADGVEEEGIEKFLASSYLPWSILGLIIIWGILYAALKRKYSMEAETPQPF
jgi:hypothetical protein